MTRPAADNLSSAADRLEALAMAARRPARRSRSRALSALSELRSASAALDPHSLESRVERALAFIESEMRSGPGNPNHDELGHFTDAGHAGHGKHHAKRQRRKRRKARLRRRFQREADALKVQHKAERKGLVERQRMRHEKHNTYYDKRKVQLDREQGRELAKMDREHGHEIAVMERRRTREREQEVRDKARGKVTDEQIAKWEADHAKDIAHISGINKEIRQKEVDWHEAQHYELKQERREATQELKESHAAQRKGLLSRQRRERKDLRERFDEAAAEHGFSVKPRGKRGSGSEGRSLVRAVHRAELREFDDGQDLDFDVLAEQMARDLAAVPPEDTARRVEIMRARLARGQELWDQQDRDRAGLRRAQRKTAEAIGEVSR